jgi:hypothetical protein
LLKVLDTHTLTDNGEEFDEKKIMQFYFACEWFY